MEANPPKKQCFGIGIFSGPTWSHVCLNLFRHGFCFFLTMKTTGCQGEITLKLRNLFNRRTSLTLKKIELLFFKIVSLLVRPVFLWLSDSLIRGALGTLT